MTVRQAFSQNKLLSAMFTVLAAALMAWGIWVTDASYKVHFTRTVELASMCLDISELKLEQKEMKIVITQNQEKIYMILMDIQRQTKKPK